MNMVVEELLKNSAKLGVEISTKIEQLEYQDKVAHTLTQRDVLALMKDMSSLFRELQHAVEMMNLELNSKR